MRPKQKRIPARCGGNEPRHRNVALTRGTAAPLRRLR
ncbi:hypothetical protein E2C01_052665 [Portunus trituberculatus]|uniref:Uncharacterized protein n=1 Tax=Portunus trituberculatus TaxID=210409 RepID=A0A5B7GNV0_PORTR|nr:hypothetical protein [Portunus trituberculatus]